MATTKSKKKGTNAARSKKANSSSVSLKSVSKSYGEEWQSDDVLKDVTVDFPAGELTVIVGPSGLSLIHISEPRDMRRSRMPSSA